MTEVDLSEAIGHGVVVRPGDTLLVGLSTRVSAQDADRLKKQAMEFLPGIKGVVFMECVSQFAVYRPEGPAADA